MSHAMAALGGFGRRLPFAMIGATVIGLMGAAMVTATLLADGNVLAVAAPFVAATALFAVWVAPVRKPLILAMFVGLAFDKPEDHPNWHSPLAPLGGMLIENLNKSVPVAALKVSLLVLLLVFLVIVRMRRGFAGRSEPGYVPAAPAFFWSLAVSLLTVGLVVAWGLANGGDAQMAKIQVQVFVPLLCMAFLLGVSLRGVRDYRVIAKVIIFAAFVKAALAMYVRFTMPYLFLKTDAYATSHGDSLLFAVALVILVAMFCEQPSRRTLLWLSLSTVVIFAGMVANNRRLAWAQLGVSLIAYFTLNRKSWATRKIVRVLVLIWPLLLVYGVVGWNSGSKIFAPVQTIRSMGDGEVNRSTWFRDVENYNLVYTLRRYPMFGMGFGRPFEEALQNDALPGFTEYHYLPHNSVLGLWSFAGGFGFAGLWCSLIVGLLLAARSYHFALEPEQRAAAAAAIATILTYLLHCWGDIGFTEPKSIFLVGAGLAVAGQLATATGAWRIRAPRRTATTHALPNHVSTD